MVRLMIYSALALLAGVWVFSSISNGVKESPLGETLIQRRSQIEKQWEQ
tara:strand:- start:122 stop:268 length:147 start_codon:yes stop_codon:yes gene_type:complete